MSKQGGSKVRHIRWSPELCRMVLVDNDGKDIDVGFGKDEPPFVPTFEWYKHNG